MKRLLGRAAILLVLVITVWYVFRDIDYQRLLDLLRNSNLVLVACTIPIIVASHIVRSTRWRRLLAQVPGRISLDVAFRATMIGYASSIVIPRSGEVLRPAFLSRNSHVPFGASLASIVVERVLDLVALLGGVALIVVTQHGLISTVFPELSSTAVTIGMIVPLLVLVLFMVLIGFTKTVPLIIVDCIACLSRRLAVRIRSMFSTVRHGFGILQSTHNWTWVGIESVVMWVLYTLTLWLLILAMPLSIGSISIVDAGVLLVIITIGITIAPTPGAVGVYHGLAQVALVRLYGATPEEGLGFALMAWLLNYGTQLILGGFSLLWQRIKKA